MNTQDLKAQVDTILATPRMKYGLLPRILFFSLDVLAGKKTTIPKAMFLEMLASIPYRRWEANYYKKLSYRYKSQDFIERAYRLVEWGRAAQDNEYWHLVVLNERLKELGLKRPWYLSRFMRWIAVNYYIAFAYVLSKLSIRSALSFNAQFEDHAMHVYAEFVVANAELEEQKIDNDIVKKYADLPTWADIFRRIAVDELEHKENSLKFKG